MAKSNVLARVEADLARGHTHPAMQRLASLIAAYPDDLELRAHRAALCRRLGDVVEAARWAFLTEDAAPAEIGAFERRQRSAWLRLRSLRLDRDLTDALGPAGRQRFALLIERATLDKSVPVTWSAHGPVAGTQPESWRDGLPCLAAVLIGLIGLILVSLLAIGLVTVVRYVLPG